jgi:hypothetical protein
VCLFGCVFIWDSLPNLYHPGIWRGHGRYKLDCTNCKSRPCVSKQRPVTFLPACRGPPRADRRGGMGLQAGAGLSHHQGLYMKTNLHPGTIRHTCMHAHTHTHTHAQNSSNAHTYTKVLRKRTQAHAHSHARAADACGSRRHALRGIEIRAWNRDSCAIIVHSILPSVGLEQARARHGGTRLRRDNAAR